MLGWVCVCVWDSVICGLHNTGAKAIKNAFMVRFILF